MKKLLILLLFFGLSNVYTKMVLFQLSSCEYDKSAINTNNKMVISLYFECISTITKSDNNLFVVNIIHMRI